MFVSLTSRLNVFAIACLGLCVGVLADHATAATPTVKQALGLRPMQADVDYDRPTGAAIEKCTVKAESSKSGSGWVVRDGAGQLLRKFLDTNRDNKVDRWCYFKDGIEVYRDVDANFNGKSDQYRWLGTAGTRWGMDKDEDRQIDSWRIISAEEVSAEVVAALRDRDASRFKRVLLTANELDSLGVGVKVGSELAKKVKSASTTFPAVAQRQKVVTADSNWIHFGGNIPGVLPSGTDGSTKDVIVYDNVTAVVETDGKHAQIAIGTLVKVENTWRVVDLPQGLIAGQANATNTGIFFNAAHTPVPEDVPGAPAIDDKLQKLITEFERINRTIESAVSSAQKKTLNEERAIVLEQLVKASKEKDDRNNWIRQYTDTVSGAAQMGNYPGGLERMKKFYESLSKDGDKTAAAAYLKYRTIDVAYSLAVQDPKAEYEKVQATWLEQLEGFIAQYPKAEDAADAMLQIGLAREFDGKDDEAKVWYKRIVSDFPSSEYVKKASGAVRRLDSVGKPIRLQGRTSDGRALDTASYRGKVLLIHYWATWCEPCKQELSTLKNLQAKYGAKGFSLVGVSLDNERADLTNYLRTNRLAWPQLFEEGGLDSRLANELGILTLPAMILVDNQGKVVKRSIHAAELDVELGKLIR